MTKYYGTEPDDIVERLEDSKGWPNLGKAAAARIRADEQALKEANEVIKAAEAVLEQTDYLDELIIPALVDLRQALQVRAKKGGA